MQSVDGIACGCSFSGAGEESLMGGIPPAEKETDRAVDRTGDPGILAGHGGHDGRAATEETRGSATVAGELATRMVGGNSPRRLVANREAAPLGVCS